MFQLEELRLLQGSKVRKEVEGIVDECVAKSEGSLSKGDFDERVFEALCSLPRDAAKQVLEEVLTSNVAAAQHKQRWLMGCIKRYLAKSASGEEFLTLEEEKAGVIERIKESSRGKARGRGGGFAGARRDGAAASGRRKSGETPAAKFKRGRIGESE